ncbi:AAA-like domain-containing protein [Candidatus Halobeggiatoa sp. HSG11]|nr:AAA-like domain-containing protein [Candidatus Halobeggiatoa sp. HSG11]
MTKQLKQQIHCELTDTSVKIFEKVGGNYEFRGTGFFITPDGYLLTAYHCIEWSPNDIFVETQFDGKFPALLDDAKSLRDLNYDIAVLKIEYEPNHYLPLGFVTDEHKTDELVSVGYPAGSLADNQEIGIYFGNISKFRSNKIENDAMKGQGHSGGLVYHYETQRVVGLVIAGYKSEIMLNTGLATRFEPLFKKWRELEAINQAVAENWDRQLLKPPIKPSPKKPPIKSLPEPPPIEPCGGAMSLNSKFYVERQVDNEFQTAIKRRDSIVLLKGPRQVGKTSLLARGLQQAREAGVIVLLTDFQKLIDSQLQSLETFFIAIGQMFARQLRLRVLPQDVWQADYPANINFENYFIDNILETTEKPVLWGIDEADILFDCPFSNEIFALFRTWHNDRALTPNSPCNKLTLTIAYATETYLFIKDQNQSPFNVGTKLFLEDFSLKQLAMLNQRYAIPLKNDKEIHQFHQLTGGQPYLVRCGLNDLVSYKMSLPEFINKATRDNGAYGEHLRRIVKLIEDDEQLLLAMQNVLRDQSCLDYNSFYRLRSAGILRGNSKDKVSLRCKIYEFYLRKHLF